MNLKPGTQIIYVPDHANGDPDHPDCERGFVTSADGADAFCRYWSKFHDGLRTIRCSERTPVRLLVVRDTVPQKKVDEALEMITHHERLCDLKRQYQLHLEKEQRRHAFEMERTQEDQQ